MSQTPAAETAPTTKRREGVASARRVYTTAEFAQQRGVLPESIRTSVWRHGHYMDVKPVKSGTSRSARLLWPAAAVDAAFDALLDGGSQ